MTTETMLAEATIDYLIALLRRERTLAEEATAADGMVHGMRGRTKALRDEAARRQNEAHIRHEAVRLELAHHERHNPGMMREAKALYAVEDAAEEQAERRRRLRGLREMIAQQEARGSRASLVTHLRIRAERLEAEIVAMEGRA